MTWIYINEPMQGTYTVRLRSQDPDLFQCLIEELKSSIPPKARRYDPDEKCWWIAARSLLDLWLEAADSYTQVRIVWESDWQSNDDAEYRDNYQAPPPPRRSHRMMRAEAYTVLHLLPTAPPEVVKAAYRTLATLHHPDKGGDVVTMQRINVAYSLLEEGAR